MMSDLSTFGHRLAETIPSLAQTSRVPGPDWDFNRLALALFAHQIAANVTYRRIVEAGGLAPGDLTHWKQIPCVPTAAFKDMELSCLPGEKRVRVFHSSGTTQQRPSRHFHSDESLAVYETAAWWWFAANMTAESAGPGRSWLMLTPPPAQVPHSSLVHMFEVIRRRTDSPESVYVGSLAGDQSWLLDFELISASLEKACVKDAPVTLMGTAFSFVHLLDWMTARRLHLKLPAGSSVMETGGYKGRSREVSKGELHQMMTRQLGLEGQAIVCEYGMSELSSQAYARGGLGGRDSSAPLFRFPSWARARVVSPETGLDADEGEPGLLHIVDLANVFSVLAIQTEDLAVWRGDGFELVGRAAHAEARGCSLTAI